MNVQLLIDAVVRQTTVLIAQLATAGGVRAPLAHVADEVFTHLSRELEAQGVSRKVGADMFGMALRAYQKKIQRLRESSTVRGQSLWSAVLSYVEASRVVTRSEVLRRFRNDDVTLVRGVLFDLVESGLVSSSGSGASAVFRRTTQEERSLMGQAGTGLLEFVWVLVYREGPLTLDLLAKSSGVGETELLQALQGLEQAGRVQQHEGQWSAAEFVVPMGSDTGWEAAVFDHHHALVKTLCARLGRSADTARMAATTGGSTYTMDVWSEHPLRDEVLGTLRRVREQLAALRARVVEFNSVHPAPSQYEAVVFYAGQCVTEEGGVDPEIST